MYHRWKKIHPDSDPPENILLRLNYIQRWDVCQKSLKILCLHSVNSLETRKKKKSCYFRLVPVFRKCVPCGTFLESSLYDVINAPMDLFRFQVFFFSSICIIVFFTLNCIDFRKKKTFWHMGRTWGLECFNNWYRRGSSAKMRPWGSSRVSIHHAVKVTAFTFSWYNLFAFIFRALLHLSLVKFPNNMDKNLF